jgi:hypothetical protein
MTVANKAVSALSDPAIDLLSDADFVRVLPNIVRPS